MIDRVVNNAKEMTDNIILVHSSQLEKYIEKYRNICQFILQPIPLGTAKAVYTAIDLIDNNKIVAVLYGDNPLITPRIIKNLLNYLIANGSAITTLCFKRSDPGEYGRIVADKLGNFLNIVEFKEATDQEKSIKICNSGVMAFKAGILMKYLPLVLEEEYRQTSEVYITRIVKIAKEQGEKVSYLLSPDHNLVIGVNTKQELEEANRTVTQLEKI